MGPPVRVAPAGVLPNVSRNVPPVQLVKAHAYGNDFLLVEAEVVAALPDMAEFARRACDRHRGVGADGLMVVRAAGSGAEMRLWNADGSRSELSGNGVRCVAAWLAGARSLTAGAEIVVTTEAGPKRLQVLDRQGPRWMFRAAMGQPEQVRMVRIDVAGETIAAVVMRVGNPQCVVLGPVTHERLRSLASRLAVHPFFPEGTNVELAEVESPGSVRILIWERGVGPTESSGTGTCAAAVAAAAFGGAARAVDVIAPGGVQRVEWTDAGLWLTGWAEVTARIDWLTADSTIPPGC
jgi:diaminopimelate epimerase